MVHVVHDAHDAHDVHDDDQIEKAHDVHDEDHVVHEDNDNKEPDHVSNPMGMVELAFYLFILLFF